MTAIVCICDGGGMLFNNRRLSRDRLLMENLSAFIGDGALYISDFSERLFEKTDLCTIVASDPLDCAEKEDFVFVENLSLAQHIDKIDRLVIYKWNRSYPFDFSLDISPEKEKMTLTESTDFKGSSHEEITREIWKK